MNALMSRRCGTECNQTFDPQLYYYVVNSLEGHKGFSSTHAGSALEPHCRDALDMCCEFPPPDLSGNLRPSLVRYETSMTNLILLAIEYAAYRPFFAAPCDRIPARVRTPATPAGEATDPDRGRDISPCGSIGSAIAIRPARTLPPGKRLGEKVCACVPRYPRGVPPDYDALGKSCGYRPGVESLMRFRTQRSAGPRKSSAPLASGCGDGRRGY